MRGRRLTAIIAAGLLAIGAAGCGGGDDVAPEVPGPPADVALPEATVAPPADENADSGDNSDDTSSTEDQGTTDESTTPEDTGTGTGTGTTDDTGGTTPDESGGTTAPEAEPDGPTNDTAPPADSEAEQFEDFCAQNPGAC